LESSPSSKYSCEAEVLALNAVLKLLIDDKYDCPEKLSPGKKRPNIPLATLERDPNLESFGSLDLNRSQR
jgi:hypothetical protein